MKVAIITPFYQPSIGGVESIARDTAEELVRRGHDVSVLTTTHANSWIKVANPGLKIINEVKIYRLKPSFLRIGYATLMRDIKGTIKELNPDIIHSHCLHPHLFQVAKWKKTCNYKVIAQLHYPEVTGIDHFSAKLTYRPIMCYLKKEQHEIDAFIAHTNLERQWLINKGIEKRKIFKVSFPCVPQKLLEYNSESTLGFELDSKRILLYIGRITWRKGLHILLQALRPLLNEIKDVVAIIAGPRDEEYYKKLLNITNQLNLSNRVIFKSSLSEEEKYQYMLSCTVFIMPSIKDYTPATLIEAQALGKPVVSTTVGAIPEIVKNGETGLLVEPENPEKLAKAIKWLLLEEDKRKSIGMKARQLVVKNFSLKVAVDKLEKLYITSK
jgi:glycosyltransferase involved in cell wall biosynthesis